MAFKQLRQRIVFTIIVVFLTRLIAHIPLPGIDTSQLSDFFSRNQVFGMLDMLSGGAMRQLSVAMMGVGPYITSSIMMQLLTIVVPRLEALSKEGSQGHYKINQYTRYLTVPMGILQAYGMIILLKSQGAIGSLPSGSDFALMLLASTAGCLLLMWLGELISENGIGNGVSLIITVGILGGVPPQIRNTLAIMDSQRIFGLIGYGVLALLTVAAIVFITEGERKVPITYARASSRKTGIGEVVSYLPIRIAAAGVIPIIFAMSFMVFPEFVGQFFSQARSAWLAYGARALVNIFHNDTFYSIFYFLLVVGFTYFYTFIIFKPEQIAENLQKQGGFIPGYRPGQETRDFLYNLVLRITLAGSIFLGLIAVMPLFIREMTGVTTLVISGTGVLIVVTVIVETLRQIRSQLLAKVYEVY